MPQPESLPRAAPPVAPPVQLPMIKEERRPSKVSKLQASRLLAYRLEHEVCEGGAAFGCLAELATRRGSPLRPVAPQEDLQSSPSSLPRRILVPAERCKPPYSHEWLLAHRARCGGSPLRPKALHPPAELSSLSASAALDAPTASRVVAPTHLKLASAPAAAGAAGAAKPLPEDDTTPNSIHALLTALDDTIPNLTHAPLATSRRRQALGPQACCRYKRNSSSCRMVTSVLCPTVYVSQGLTLGGPRFHLPSPLDVRELHQQ